MRRLGVRESNLPPHPHHPTRSTAQVLEDEHFLPGDAGEEIIETLGEMMREVRLHLNPTLGTAGICLDMLPHAPPLVLHSLQGGFAKNDDEVKAKCAKLAKGLGRFSMKEMTRALDTGPIKLK